jgi:hemerythrin
MSQIEWQKSYSVNNSEIDEQHKKWIAIYNEMDKCLLSGDQKELIQIAAKSLKSMHDYANFHFKFEEEYMQKINYPDLVSHKRLHKDFDNIIYKYHRDIDAGELIINTEILKKIKEWLVKHILVQDKKYAAES